MLRYKIDVLKTLKEHGITTTRFRNEKIIGEMTLTKIRRGHVMMGYQTIDALCKLLDMQPGDILEYIPDDPEQTEEQPQEPDDIF